MVREINGKVMNEFKNYHPIVNFIYFLAVIVFSCLFFNPLLLFISLASGFVHSLFINCTKALKLNFLYMLPIVIFTALINPLFSHEGITIIAYFPNVNPLTYEAIWYGVFSAVMLWSIICHFSCFNAVITSDKFIYLFGKITPSISLVLSMILRFVPRFKVQLKEVSDAQKSMGFDISRGSIFKRTKYAIKIISIMLTRSLEDAIDTADSMKSRGYGLTKRTAYANYTISKRDVFTLLYMAMLILIIIIAAFKGCFYFKFYPMIKGPDFTHFSAIAYTAYVLLFVCPIIIELKEAIKWKILKSKI